MLLCWWRTRSVGDFGSILGRLRCLDDISIFLLDFLYSDRMQNLQLIQPKLTNRPQKAPSTTSHACAPPSGGGPIAGVAGAGPSAIDFSAGGSASSFSDGASPFSGSLCPCTFTTGMVVALSIEGETSVSLLAIFVGEESSRYRPNCLCLQSGIKELDHCILKYGQFIDLISNEDGKYKIKK